jgi:sterol carrier protein 2
LGLGFEVNRGGLNSMTNTVRIAGVGMTPFAKPGRSDTYDVMGREAVRRALADAGLDYSAIQQSFVGHVYGDSTCGQATLYGLGQTGIPIINVNNNCSTGSSALWMARLAVEAEMAECVLAVGFEQMVPGALKSSEGDRPSPLERFMATMAAAQGANEDEPFAAQLFAGAAETYARRYGLLDSTLAKIAVKARRHAAANPYAVFRDQITEDDVLSSPRISGRLTRLQCCPPTCGAAAAVVVSERYAKEHGLRAPVKVRGQALRTDTPTTFDGVDMMNLVGYDMSAAAADEVYEKTGVDPGDVDVVELHDCFTSNELISYESLKLTPPGTAEKFVVSGENTYGGRVVVNPSGGLLSKGHPLGATGLAQCAELVWQLRGVAEERQVEGARMALQHNIGLGGAAVVTLYEAA